VLYICDDSSIQIQIQKIVIGWVTNFCLLQVTVGLMTLITHLVGFGMSYGLSYWSDQFFGENSVIDF